jgi:hypothetical protein
MDLHSVQDNLQTILHNDNFAGFLTRHDRCHSRLFWWPRIVVHATDDVMNAIGKHLQRLMRLNETFDVGRGRKSRCQVSPFSSLICARKARYKR